MSDQVGSAMSSLEALLVVQDHDTAVDQLRHRLRTMPERSELQALETQQRSVAVQRAEVAERRDEVAGRQAGLEQTIAASEGRIAEIDARMYSGQVSASRELQAMATEIDSIKQRISRLEDAALETMDEREPLDQTVEELDRKSQELAGEGEQLRAAIAANEAAIHEQLAQEQEARAEAANAVPEELLATYERLRTRLGGVGAARLEHGTCMGCRLRLPASELDRLKREPPETLLFCEQCGRILVR